jgi:hypothetical protein
MMPDNCFHMDAIRDVTPSARGCEQNAEQTYENAMLSRVRAQAVRYTDTAALY